jgi:hypothetical protein
MSHVAPVNPQTAVPTLPFVADVRIGKGRLRRSFWHVQPSGDFERDNATGVLFARCALAQMRADGMPWLLAWIVKDMPRSPEHQGLAVGFFSEIARVALNHS